MNYAKYPRFGVEICCAWSVAANVSTYYSLMHPISYSDKTVRILAPLIETLRPSKVAKHG